MNAADDTQLVIFRVGGHEFAFDILQVERIVRYEPPVPLPQTPAFLEGVITYDGAAVPVIDLRKRFELDAPIREETRLVILGLDDQRIAVAVDDVREVLRVARAALAPPGPLVRGLAAVYITGIVTQPGRTIVVLNSPKLLSSAERLALVEAGVAVARREQ